MLYEDIYDDMKLSLDKALEINKLDQNFGEYARFLTVVKEEADRRLKKAEEIQERKWNEQKREFNTFINKHKHILDTFEELDFMRKHTIIADWVKYGDQFVVRVLESVRGLK